MINKMKTEKVCKEIELCHKLRFSNPYFFFNPSQSEFEIPKYTIRTENFRMVDIKINA